jgi:hypothetical protein
MSQTAQIKKTTKRGENEQFIAARPSSKTWMLEGVETDPNFGAQLSVLRGVAQTAK